MINVKKNGFHNKAKRNKKTDPVMLLLLRRPTRDAVISKHSRRFGKRRQLRRGAGNNDRFRKDGARKTKNWLTNRKKVLTCAFREIENSHTHYPYTQELLYVLRRSLAFLGLQHISLKTKHSCGHCHSFSALSQA